MYHSVIATVEITRSREDFEKIYKIKGSSRIIIVNKHNTIIKLGCLIHRHTYTPSEIKKFVYDENIHELIFEKKFAKFDGGLIIEYKGEKLTER